LRLEKSTVLKLISWKHSFKRLNEEYEITKKKKQALDNLFETGRISQATRDSFNNDITAAITEIEKQQKDLLGKMQIKTQELQDQIKTLETLFANYEIQHVVGEIDEEIYQLEINLLATGLETAKHELDTIKEASSQLCPPAETPTAEPPAPPQESEVVQSEPVENVAVAPVEVEVATEPCSQEPVITIEEAVPEQPSTESADAAPTEAPQPVEETPQEAHPSEAPQEAPQEIIVEPISEQTQCAEEAPAATETKAENTENQQA
jgi:hypothetical protein